MAELSMEYLMAYKLKVRKRFKSNLKKTKFLKVKALISHKKNKLIKVNDFCDLLKLLSQSFSLIKSSHIWI